MANESDAPRSKLEEQATAKADLSYSYWAKEGLKQDTFPASQAPRKLTEEEERAQQEQLKQATASGASAWNHAGTFEEKSCFSWVKERLEQIFAGTSFGSVTFKSVTDINGDAHIWIVRGKKRCGFDLSMKVKFTATINGKEIKGDCKFSEASSDDLDDMQLLVEISGKKAEHTAEEAEAVKQVSGLKGQVQELLVGLLEELKSK